MKAFGALLLVLLLSGCASVYMSSPGSMNGIDVKGATGKPDRVVVVNNSACYFLWNFPIVSGDLTWDEETQDIQGGVRFFKGLTGFGEVNETMHRIASREKCSFADLLLTEQNNPRLALDYNTLFLLLWLRAEVGMSGVLCLPENTLVK